MRAAPLFLVIAAGQAVRTPPALSQSLQPGQRVRVTAPEVWRERRAFAYHGMAADSLLLRVPDGRRTALGLPDGAVIRVPQALVTRLDVSSGPVSSQRYALGVGAAAAIVGGAFLAARAATSDVKPCTPQEGLFCDRVSGESAGNLVKGILVFVPGALLAGGVFRLITAERWRTVPGGEWRLAVDAGPEPAGQLALRLSLRR